MAAVKGQGIWHFSHSVDVGIELLPADPNTGAQLGKCAGNRGLGQQMARPVVGKPVGEVLRFFRKGTDRCIDTITASITAGIGSGGRYDINPGITRIIIDICGKRTTRTAKIGIACVEDIIKCRYS